MTERLLRSYLSTYLHHKFIVVPVKIIINNNKKEPHFPVAWGKFETISLDVFAEFVYPQLPFEIATHVAVLLQPSGLCVFDFDGTENMPSNFVQQVIDYAEQEKIPMVRSGRGIHLYFKQSEAAAQLPSRISVGGGWIEVKRSGVIFAPLTDNDNYYRWVIPLDSGGLRELTEEDLQHLLPDNGRQTTKVTQTSQSNEKRKIKISQTNLTEEQIDYIVNLIIPYYTRGRRNDVVFSLAGMLRKLGVSYEDTLRIVRFLIERTGDEEPQNRIDVVRRTYEKSLNDSELVGSSKLAEILGDKSIIYQVYSIVKGEPIKFDEGFIKLFATTRWWFKQVEDIVKQNYIALTDNEGRVTVVRKFDIEKGVWVKIKEFKEELTTIVAGVMQEWEVLLLNADCDNKTRYALLYKLFKVQPQREVSEIYTELLQSIRVNAEEFYAPPKVTCSVCKDNIINIVACQTHFIFICACGHIELIEKSEIDDPKTLRVFTYIPASLPADPQVAYEHLSGYGKELMHTLLRVASYVILSRRNFKRKIFIFTGVTSSGKTTFCELLKLAVNKDYASFAANALTVRGDATHATRASLASHKLAVFSELPPTALSNDNFKLLTDITIPARFLYKNPADFYNISNIIITTNYNLNTNSVDAAVVERVVLVCFEKMFYNNKEVAQFYVADEKHKAIEEFAQRLWNNKEFRDNFLAALLAAWVDLCNDDFQFQVDQASQTRQAWLMNETLSVDAFSQLLQLDVYEYYPIAVLFDLYRRYCEKVCAVGVTDIKQFGAKLVETAIGRVARKKLLRTQQYPDAAVIYANKFNVKLPERGWCYSLKPSPKLLELLQIDLSDDNNDNTPTAPTVDLFEDDEQIINETITIAENENETPVQISQNCANCGSELIVKNNQLICEHCNATVYFCENTIIEVDEDQIPKKCIICGNQIDLNKDNDCKVCKTKYRVRINFPF